VLNLPKGVFPSGYVPLDPGNHILSQKLLVDVGVDTFTGENHYRWRKSMTHSSLIVSFRPLAVTSGPGCHLGVFHRKNEVPTGAGARADLRERSVPHKAFSDELAASDITS
jgi:hypothetical protein